MTAFVSVIIPTYNRAYCVVEAIESVLGQTFQDFELIVVDDGSTDATAEVLAPYVDRIRYIYQKNAGVSAARNTGIRAARGQWIAFLDSDDVWLPEKLEIQVEGVHAHPTAVAHMVDALIELPDGGRVSTFEIRGLMQSFTDRPFRERPLMDVLKAQFFTSTWMLLKDTAEKVSGFDRNKRIYEDLDLLARVALLGPFVVSCHPGVIIKRGQGDKNALSNLHWKNRVESLKNLIHTYQCLQENERLEAREKKFVSRQLGGVFHELALEFRKRDDKQGYWEYLIKSVKSDLGGRAFMRAFLSVSGLYGTASRIMTSYRRKHEIRRSNWSIS